MELLQPTENMQVFGVSEFAPEMERWNIGYQIIQKNKLFHMATNGDEHVGPETVMGGGGSRTRRRLDFQTFCLTNLFILRVNHLLIITGRG